MKLGIGKYLVIMLWIGMAAAGERNAVDLQRSARDLDFIKAACRVTLYREVCVASLASYAGIVRRNQGRLVRTAVQVSLGKAQNASAFLANLAKGNAGGKRQRGALRDCVENFGDAVSEIKHSLAELKKLRPKTFQFQMSNVQTWMSAALTDQDSCLDGFHRIHGGLQALVAKKVQAVFKLGSNALALVNDYAATGPAEVPAGGNKNK